MRNLLELPSIGVQTDYVKILNERSSDKTSILASEQASVQSHIERQQRARKDRESKDSRSDVKLNHFRQPSYDSAISKQLEVASKLGQNADEKLDTGKSLENTAQLGSAIVEVNLFSNAVYQ